MKDLSKLQDYRLDQPEENCGCSLGIYKIQRYQGGLIVMADKTLSTDENHEVERVRITTAGSQSYPFFDDVIAVRDAFFEPDEKVLLVVPPKARVATEKIDRYILSLIHYKKRDCQIASD